MSYIIMNTECRTCHIKKVMEFDYRCLNPEQISSRKCFVICEQCYNPNIHFEIISYINNIFSKSKI